MAKSKKPKIVPVREPNGRLSRAAAEAVGACSPAEVRRLRDAALKGMQAPEWASEIGRLFLSGKLTEDQYEAAKRWGRLVINYHIAIGSPKPFPKTATFLQEPKGHEPDSESDEFKRRAKWASEIVLDMQEAHAVLISVGKLAEHSVRKICEDDQAPVGELALLNLIDGLRWLSLHWGITQQAKAS